MNIEDLTLNQLIEAGDQYLDALRRDEKKDELGALRANGFIKDKDKSEAKRRSNRVKVRKGAHQTPTWKSQREIMKELVAKKVFSKDRKGHFKIKAQKVIVGPPGFPKKRVLTLVSLSGETYNQHARVNLTNSGVNTIGVNQLNESFISVVDGGNKRTRIKRFAKK